MSHDEGMKALEDKVGSMSNKKIDGHLFNFPEKLEIGKRQVEMVYELGAQAKKYNSLLTSTNKLILSRAEDSELLKEAILYLKSHQLFLLSQGGKDKGLDKLVIGLEGRVG